MGKPFLLTTGTTIIAVIRVTYAGSYESAPMHHFTSTLAVPVHKLFNTDLCVSLGLLGTLLAAVSIRFGLMVMHITADKL